MKLFNVRIRGLEVVAFVRLPKSNDPSDVVDRKGWVI